MKKRTILSMLTFSALVFACKKNNDSSSAPANALVGKWNLTTYAYHKYFYGVDYRDTARYNTGQFTYEFKNDGKLIRTYGLSSDTINYKLLDDKTVILKSDTGTVQTVTNSDLSLYFKSRPNSNGDYSEDWYTFKK
jgi:hypothetical protein